MCALLLTTSMALYAEIYTWKDSKGVTHYSNQPFSSADYAQKITIGNMNQMQSVAFDEPLDSKNSKNSKNSKKKLENDNRTSRLKQVKQCNEWRIELVSLKRKLKKGYALKEAKRLKAEKLALKGQLWRMCR